MRRFTSIPVVVLALLLISCLAAVYFTENSRIRLGANPQNTIATSTPNAAVPSITIDRRLLVTANQMATAAVLLSANNDEQNQAREAQHLADHELDMAFETAMRETTAYRAPATGPLRELIATINGLKTEVEDGQKKIAQLTLAAKTETNTNQLALANAELVLDRDELADAQQDLARRGGDPHAALVRALQEHEAAQHESAQQLAAQQVQSVKNPMATGTLVEQVRAWFALSNFEQQLSDAARQAADQGALLDEQHDALDSQVTRRKDTQGNDTTGAGDAIASLRQRSEHRKTLTELDQRIQDCQQLAQVYRDWRTLLRVRRASVLHLLLISLAEILAVLFAAALAIAALRRVFHRPFSSSSNPDTNLAATLPTNQAPQFGRRMQQTRVMIIFAIQLLAGAIILLVVFGVPNQISTIIGLATAGITVVLRDFIVGFIGWFVLMGKNGIHVGDWVEINGVSGEVIEIGLLKTVLLELGNRSDTGHPTGRQVAFSNSFAMDGHYFNFSTDGQWLWDELEVTVPAAGDPYQLAEEIRTLVEKETAADAAQAAQEWQRVTNRYGARSFAAQPAVNLRPTAAGLEVVVRYITHAQQRYEMKSKLFRAIVDLQHKPASAEIPAT